MHMASSGEMPSSTSSGKEAAGIAIKAAAAGGGGKEDRVDTCRSLNAVAAVAAAASSCTAAAAADRRSTNIGNKVNANTGTMIRKAGAWRSAVDPKTGRVYYYNKYVRTYSTCTLAYKHMP